MSEVSNLNQAAAVDPLSQAASGIDTTFPLLAPDRVYRMTCVSATKGLVKDEQKAAQGQESFIMKLVTTKEAKSDKGKVLNAGFPLYKRIGVSEVAPEGDKQGRTMADVAKGLALVLKAFFGPTTTKTPRELLDNPKMLEGLPVDVKVGILPEKNNFPASNTVTFVIPG